MSGIWNSLVSNFKDINVATLSGAIDIIVIEQNDGSLRSSPWHVRFGKTSVFRSRGQPVRITVNERETNLQMRVGRAGEAFFAEPSALSERSEASMGEDDPPVVRRSAPDLETGLAGTLDEDLTPQGLFDMDESGEGQAAAVQATAAAQTAPVSTGSRTMPRDIPRIDTSVARGGAFAPSPSDPQSPLDASFPQSPMSDAGAAMTWEWGRMPKTVDVAHELGAHEAGGIGAALAAEGPAGAAPSGGGGSGLSSTLTPRGALGVPAGAVSVSAPELALHPAAAALVAAAAAAAADPTSSAAAEAGTAAAAPNTPAAAKGSSWWPFGGWFRSRPREDAFLVPRSIEATLRSQNGIDPLPMPVRSISARATSTYSDAGDALAPVAVLGENSVIELSACGPLFATIRTRAEAATMFNRCAVTFEEFSENPLPFVRDSGAMVFRIDGEYFTWEAAAAIVFARVLYGKALPRGALGAVPCLRFDGEDAGPAGGLPAATAPASLAGTPGRVASPLVSPLGGSPVGSPRNRSVPSSVTAPGSPRTSAAAGAASAATAAAAAAAAAGADADALSTGSGESRDAAGEEECIVPTPEQLASLGLVSGRNTVVFTVRGWRGVVEQHAFIYVWPANAKIVISDIDGTITRSDVLGQVLPMLGGQWAQSGVTELFQSIVERGYRIVYVSSRAIGQANTTRSYIEWVSEGGVTLPPGPILMSPDRLLASFHREVIRRRPEEFKIACLGSVRQLFPIEHNPFHAGFGNRITDVISYRSVAVPQGRVFIINPAGEIEVAAVPGLRTTYRSLNELRDEVFPSVLAGPGSGRPGMPVADDSFNEWSFWRLP